MVINSIQIIKNIKETDIYLPDELYKNIESWKTADNKILINYLNENKVIGSVFLTEFPFDVYNPNNSDIILYKDLYEYFEKPFNKHIPLITKPHLIQYLYVNPLFRRRKVATNMIKHIKTHYDFIAACDSVGLESVFKNAGCITYGRDSCLVNPIFRSK